MKSVGVIGHPLGHSLSPAIHKVAFEDTGIEAHYEAWPTPPEELEARISGLRADNVLGANVTIPHKETVIPMLDRMDERPERLGAVNTIVNEGAKLAGHNTDVAGFERALREEAGFDPKGRRVTVLGSGGAARAVVLALIEGGASTILVSGEIPQQLEKLVSDMRGMTGPGAMLTSAHWLDGACLRGASEADLLVNCTPVGMSGGDADGEIPIPAEYVPSDGVVFDLVYNPTETPLLREAKERGAKAVSGLSMLVYQAAESFRLWTGKDAPVEKMLAAAREALEA